jgi:hypothetical protein
MASILANGFLFPKTIRGVKDKGGKEAIDDLSATVRVRNPLDFRRRRKKYGRINWFN